MGSVISAHCDCGYENNDLHLGGGMMNFTTQCSFPYYCKACKILFEGNILEKRCCCPECGKDNVVSYDDERACKSKGAVEFFWDVKGKIGKELTLTDGKYYCPACGKFRLTFSNIGFRD